MDRSDLNIHWKVVDVGKTGTGEEEQLEGEVKATC